MAFEASKKLRDKRLRAWVLRVLRTALAVGMRDGQVGAETLVREVNTYVPRDMRFEDDSHARIVLAELRLKGLIEEIDTRRRPGSEAHGFAFLAYRITSTGMSLLNQTAPVDLDIEDDRVEE
jgi:hypothetical protein